MPQIFECLSVLPERLRARARQALISEWTCSSAGLEGNAFTLAETDLFLWEETAVPGRTWREHREIRGHADAVMLLEEMAVQDIPLTREHLFDLHRLVQAGAPFDAHAPVGAFKTGPNGTMVRTAEGRSVWREYPSPGEIPGLVDAWLRSFNLHGADWESAVRLHAALHVSFACIHPFADGNGRMARLVSNLPLLRAGLPPVIVPREWRGEYISILGRTWKGGDPEECDTDEFEALASRAWKRTWDVLDRFAGTAPDCGTGQDGGQAP